MAKRSNSEITVARDAWCVYRWRAAKKGLAFELTFDKYFELIKTPCHYCGGFTKNKSIRNKFGHNGVDRVDNQVGYIPGNWVACCYICNKAKSNLALKEFEAWMDRLVKFRSSKPNLSPQKGRKQNDNYNTST